MLESLPSLRYAEHPPPSLWGWNGWLTSRSLTEA